MICKGKDVCFDLLFSFEFWVSYVRHNATVRVLSLLFSFEFWFLPTFTFLNISGRVVLLFSFEFWLEIMWMKGDIACYKYSEVGDLLFSFEFWWLVSYVVGLFIDAGLLFSFEFWIASLIAEFIASFVRPNLLFSFEFWLHPPEGENVMNAGACYFLLNFGASRDC